MPDAPTSPTSVEPADDETITLTLTWREVKWLAALTLNQGNAALSHANFATGVTAKLLPTKAEEPEADV